MRQSILFVALMLAAVLATGCELGGEDPFEGGDLYLDPVIEPNPPTLGEHTIYITVTTDTGEIVPDAEFEVDVGMPIQGISSSEIPQVTPLGGGEFEIYPVTFDQAGKWEVSIVAYRTTEDDVYQEGYRVLDYIVE